jgi:hypothetical protein
LVRVCSYTTRFPSGEIFGDPTLYISSDWSIVGTFGLVPDAAAAAWARQLAAHAIINTTTSTEFIGRVIMGNLLGNVIAVYPGLQKKNPQPIGSGFSPAVIRDLYSTAFVAIVFLYHSALSFGVRFNVLKST